MSAGISYHKPHNVDTFPSRHAGSFSSAPADLPGVAHAPPLAARHTSSVQLAHPPRSRAAERRRDSWEPFTFTGPPVRRILPSWLRGAERGAASGLVGIVVGPLPFYVLYIW